MSGARRSRFLDSDRLARFADTAAEIGVAEVSRPWAETYIAIGVAFVVAHFANGGATTLAGAAAALLAAVGVSAVRRSEVPGLRTGSEVVLGGLMALAVVGAGRMVPTGIIAAITLVAGLALLRAVVAWEFHLRQIPGGATHRDRVVALAVSTVILFAASIGITALVPGIVTLPGTPSARPDPVGPLAILAVGIGSAAVAALLAANPHVHVTSIDASAAMLALAEPRVATADHARVLFLCADIRTAALPRNCDLIVTLFSLDCFTDEDAARVVARLGDCAAPHAQWLFADFAVPARGLDRPTSRAVYPAVFRFTILAKGLGRAHTGPDGRVETSPSAQAVRKGRREQPG